MKSFLSLVLTLTGISLISGVTQAQEQHTFSLKECINYGLQHHQSVLLYQNNVRYSQQQAKEALSAYLPQVNINAGLDNNLKLQQTIIPAGTFGPGTPEQRIAFGTQYNSSMMVQLDQKIYDQSLITGLKANKPNVALSALNEEANNENIIYNIANAYFQIIVNQKNLELLYSNRDRFEKLLKVTELQASQGVVKKVDVKQVQVNLNNVLAQISVLENNLSLARNTLKNSMGLDQSQQIVLADTSRWLNAAPPSKAYRPFDYNLTLAGQQEKVQIQLYDINRKSIRDQSIPTLSVYGRYGANGFGTDNIGQAYDPLLDYSAIGVKLSWGIFTGLRRDAQYKKALIDLDNAKVQHELNEDQKNLQFQNASAKVIQAQSTIATNKSTMELASEVYENATLQFRQGVSSITDLLNAESSYREAQKNYITSLLDYYLADLSVQQSNGTLNEYYNQL